MKLKKAAAILMVMTMTAGLAACGSESSSDGSGSGDDPGKYVIGICQQMEHPSLDDATAGFQDACKELFGEDNVEFDVQNAQGEQTMCSTIMNNFVSSITQGGQNLLNSLQYYLPSVVWFFTGFVQGNVLYIFLDIILALAVSGITITLLSLLYKKINFNLLKVAKPKVKGEISFKKKSVSASLLKIEAKRFLSYPSYVLNSCFGLIFMLVIPFFFKFAVFSGEGMEEIALELATIIPIITICINAMLAGMTNTTASSISLEGKQIVLLKSLPIKPSKIYFNKILFNNLLAIPVIIVSNIINLILFFEYFNVFSGIFLFLVPILAVLSVSTFGLLINLLMPKFNFENVNQVIKQSVCVLIILLLAMVLGIVPMIISFYIPALNLNLFLIIYALLYLILFIVSIAILKIKGEKLYSKLKI